MNSSALSTLFLTNFQRSVSRARFDAYKLSGASDLQTLATYIWNILLCEALYPGFHTLEVLFRKAVHREIASIADSTWLTSEIRFLYEYEIRDIQVAKQEIQKRGLVVTEPLLIAELSFGFWTSLLDSRYDRMWPQIIAGVFPNMPKSDRTRKKASALMQPVRKLRNKVMHHHSIWHWSDLKDQHAKMVTLITFICPDLAKMMGLIDRFPKVFTDGTKECLALAQQLTG